MSDAQPTPGPDVSVRVAWADDAAAIAAVQVEAWRQEYAEVLPADLLASLDAEAFAAGWHQALTRPEDARNRVLVALERATVRGYAVTGPSPDPDADPGTDGEISDLVVHPAHRRAGHGSRLLQACIDTLRADKFLRGVCWLTSTDDARRRFLAEAGWDADGAHRELDLRGDGAVRVRQIRMHTGMTDSDVA